MHWSLDGDRPCAIADISADIQIASTRHELGDNTVAWISRQGGIAGRLKPETPGVKIPSAITADVPSVTMMNSALFNVLLPSSVALNLWL